MDVGREDVKCYLSDVKSAVISGRYQVSAREKNRQLYVDYVFTEAKCKEILLSLTVDDFCEAVQNDHPKHPEEILFIFGKDVLLLPRFGDAEEKVSLYIKFNKLTNQFLIIVSFHRQEFPVKYKFR